MKGVRYMKKECQAHKNTNRLISGAKRWTAIMLIIIALAGITGCTKQRANLSLNKAQKLLTEAEKYNAPRLKPQEYEQVKRQVEEAQRMMQESNFKRALETAGNAVDNAEAVVESTKSERAAELLNQAKEALDVANRNDGVNINRERYSKINELYNKANEEYNDNDWGNVIELSNQAIQEVDTLLSQLKDKAQRKLTEARNKFEQMKNLRAEEYAPNFVIDVRGMISTIEEKINNQRDYRGAINQADEAIRRAEEGVIATKGKMAQEKITKIENGLSDAMNKGAQIHAPELLKSANDMFDTIIELYYQKSYDKVLESADILIPKVENLIYVTRMESARERINTVQQEIEKLVAGGAPQYLPGSVETIREYLNEAQQLFEKEEFEDAENQCVLALREAEKTRAAFNDLALDAMRNGAESLDIARNVFDKMQDVFIIQADMQLEGINLRFEQGKALMRENLDQILNKARQALGIAKLRQEEGKYRRAIELSEEVRQSAEYVLNETYHVVAHNAVMELASKITQWEMQGARLYAASELERTRNLLEQAKTLIDERQFREAVRKASETRAQLELTVQEIAQTAVESINKAKQEVEDIEKYKTSEYAPELLEQARRQIQEAEAALLSENLKNAIETARTATQTAQMANQQAVKQWSSELLEKADAEINKAEKAGALGYAGEVLDEAKRFNQSAENLYETANYLEAKNVAQRAIEKANEAFYKNVTNAETAINQAKSYNGWKYEYRLLTQAIIDAKRSRTALENENYQLAVDYAKKAEQQALTVVSDAKKEAFKNKVGKVQESVDVAMNSGVNYFQPKDAKEMLSRLVKIQDNFEEENFDYINNRLQNLEADLERLIANTPDVLENIINEQKMRFSDLNDSRAEVFAPELLEKADDNLRFAKIDFDREDYAKSYRNLKNAVSYLNRVENLVAVDNYSEQIGEIMSDLSEILYDFQHVINLGPEMLYRFTLGPTGKAQYVSIAGRMSPYEFRQAVTELYYRARQIEPPQGTLSVHQNVLDMLNDLRQSAIYFEKLVILDEYEPDNRREIIQKAFKILEIAKEKRADLQEAFHHKEWGIEPESAVFQTYDYEKRNI